MPGTQNGTHPSGAVITFEEASHTYVDQEERFYRSFTTLIHDYFPKFDAEATAAKLAAKRAVSAESLIAQWKLAGEEACDYGTRTHEICEYRLKGLPPPNEPRDEKEANTFRMAEEAVDFLKREFEFIAAEKILFSPRCLVAGTVDLMMADGDQLLILDWKTNKAIRRKGFAPCLPPIDALDDCNFNAYSLQLSMAEVIAKMERYIPYDVKCRRALLYLPPMGSAAEWIDTPDLSREVYEMLIDHVTNYNNVPF